MLDTVPNSVSVLR